MLIEFPTPIDNRLQYIIPYFNMWCNKNNYQELSVIIKICRFRRNIIANNFIAKDVKELSFRYLDYIVRTVYLKNKYYKLWIFKILNSKSSVNLLDLELNVIGNNDDIIVYIDSEERKKYLFTQKDFNKLIKSNLENSYAYDAVPEPLPIKNPYTNKIILKKDLITIDNSLKNPPLSWSMYKSCRYDINLFKNIHYLYLLNMCISSFIDSLENDDIVFYLHDMFEFYKIDNYCKMCIDEYKNIRSKLVRIMLINWIAALKLAKPFRREDMYYLLKMYGKPCNIHCPKRIIGSRYIPQINIQFTGGPLNPNIIYVFKAKSISIDKQRNIDKTEGYRKKLKRRFGIKTIE